MAEGLIVRSLRDGSLPGEHAPALCLQDSLLSPAAHAIFRHLLTSLLSQSKSTRVVLVAFHRSPSFYLSLLDPAPAPRIRILDCYSDPLAWNPQSHSQSHQNTNSSLVTLLTNVTDLHHLLSSILHLAQDLGAQGYDRVAVAIDSVTHLLRHAPLPSVLQLLSNLRSHDKISSLFWLIHTDLHEPKVISSFEYISTMVASLEPILQLPDYANTNSPSITSLDENYSKAKFNVRLKRRNGRVKLLCEELLIEQGSVKFSSVPSVSSMVAQNLIPKVQFNLQLSDKERMDRANVVLPFEHQGNGQNIQIYDGRRSLTESQKDPTSTKIGGLSEQKRSNNNNSEKGEIHYLRDSDDEQPDSDEDPDDDLDI